MFLTPNYLTRITGFLVDNLFLKQRCFICDGLSKYSICNYCSKQITTLNNYCHGCGIRLTNNHKLHYCGSCLTKPLLFDRVYPMYDYKDIKKLIFAFKYNKNLSVGKFFAHIIYDFYNSNFLDYDIVVPMPLHKKRLSDRGFNQSSELVRFLPNIDYFSIIRDKNTKSLNQLNTRQRVTELRNAFRVIKNIQANKILIVDDILTTTSSTNELSRAIRKHYKQHKLNPPKIDLLVLARTHT